jgi:hypothetical protein
VELLLYTARVKLTAIGLVLLLAGAAGAQFSAPDPSTNTPSGRVLGIGRAGAALSGDTFDIFLNPAGLAQADNWAVSSMSGKLLDEYSYLSFAGYYPTNVGTFGFGFMGSSIGGAFATMRDPESSLEDPIYIIDYSKPQINYFSNVMALSYGSNLSRFFNRFGWEKQLSVGASLKMFSSALSGGDITQGGATGTELNLGLLYDTNLPYLTVGAVLQNALPSSLGGRLRYDTGHEESYPAALRLGGVVRVIGKNNSLRTIGSHDLKVVLDYNTYPTLSLPGTIHLGAEYSPLPLISLRAGLDQDVVGNGTGTGMSQASSLTGGVGFNMGGFRFDYAYNQYSWATNSSTNYISLTYSPPLKAEQKAADQVVFTSPVDKTITFDATARVKGVVVDPAIFLFTIGGKGPKMDLSGNFDQTVDLTIGKNRVAAVGKDRAGKQNFDRSFRLLRLTTFPDVPTTYWVAQPVSLLAMTNVITGYPDGTFRPEGNITRAEMCSLLMKTKTGPTTSETSVASQPPARFKDVPSTHWASRFIAEAASTGVVKGYPGNVFKPAGKITRAEGLAMITRFAGVSEEVYQYEFPDVSYNHWASKLIAGANKAGLLEFLAGRNFEADQALTRAETVELLQRTLYVQSLLKKDLLNWDTY